jgi:hypothetical protein
MFLILIYLLLILQMQILVKTHMKANPRELNPYLKDGYPEESDEVKVGASQLLSSSVVGDGGASWRLKALKRAQEQAAREGRSFQEVLLLFLCFSDVSVHPVEKLLLFC